MNPDSPKQYTISENQNPHTVTFMTGPDEMLRVSQDGFYVRGVKVPADDKEAKAVYNAFQQWLIWQNLNNDYR